MGSGGKGGKKQKVGNKYYAGIVTVPVRQHDFCFAIELNDKLAFKGRADNTRLLINKPNLFGGDEREGGFVGEVDIQNGNNSQGINAYLSAAKSTLTGAMRGCVSFVWRKPYWSANTARLPKIRTLHSNIKGWSGDWEKSLAVIEREPVIDNAAVFFTIDRSRQVDVRSFQRKLETVAAFVRGMKGGTNSIYIFVDKHPSDTTVARITLERHNVSTDTEYDEIADIVLAIEKTFFSLNGDPLDISAASGFFATANDTSESDSFIQPLIDIFGSNAESVGKTNVIVPIISLSYSVTNFNTLLAGLQSDGYAVEVVCIGGEGISGQDGRDTCFLLNGQVDIDVASDIPFAAADPDDPELSSDIRRLQHVQAPFRDWQDINPAHVLRTLWTDPMRGGSVPTSEIGDSFAVEAQRYFDEGLGISCKFRGLDNLEADRQEVERHIDAMTYRDPQTGKIELVSIRNDYVVAELDVFDNNVVLDWSQLSRPQRSELPNQLTVKYTRRDGETGSVTRTNVAGVRRKGRIVKAQEVAYPYFTTESLAIRACLRDIRTVAAPVWSGILPVAYLPTGYTIGSTFILNNPTLGINNVIMRISEIRYGEHDDSVITLSVSEDKYSTTQQVTVARPNNSSPLVRPAVDVDPVLIQEASYYQLVLAGGQTTVDDELSVEPDLGRVFVTGAPGNSDQLEARVATASAGGTSWEDKGLVDFEPFGALVNGLSSIATDTTFLVSTNNTLDEIFAGDLARLNEEIIRIDNIEDQEDGTFLVTCGRGCLDSVPQTHGAGDRFLIVSTATPQLTDYIAGQSIDVKLLSRTNSDQQSLGRVGTTTLVFDSRAFRPYPVGQFQVNASYANPPSGITTAVATWAHRDRTIQTTPSVDDHTAGNIGPEDGVFYTPFVKLYGLRENFFTSPSANFFANPSDDFFTDLSTLIKTELFEDVLSPIDDTTYTFDLSIPNFFASPSANFFAEPSTDFFEGSYGLAGLIAVGVRTSRGSPAYDNRVEPEIRFAPLKPPSLELIEDYDPTFSGPAPVVPLGVGSFLAFGSDWSTMSDVTVAAPSGLAAGNLILATVCAGISGASIIPPEGFRPITTVALSSGVSATFYKIAGASEPADYTFRTAGATRMLAGLTRITGHDSAQPIEAIATTESESNSTDHTCPSVTTATNNCLVMRLVNGHNGSSITYTPPVGVTEIFDITHTASGTDAANMALGWEVQATAGATGTASWTATSAMDRRNHTIAVKPINAASAPVVESSSTAIKEATTTTSSIDKNFTAEEAGQLLIAFVAFTGTPATITAPAGWTEVRQDADGQLRRGVFWRTAADTSPTTYTFTATGSPEGVTAILGVNGANTSSPVDVSAVAGEAFPSVTQTVDNVLHIAMPATARGNDDTVNKENTLTLTNAPLLEVVTRTIGASGAGLILHTEILESIGDPSFSGTFNADSSNTGTTSVVIKGA